MKRLPQERKAGDGAERKEIKEDKHHLRVLNSVKTKMYMRHTAHKKHTGYSVPVSV